MWIAQRSTPTNVFEVNGTTDDTPSFVSQDGCRLHLTRTIRARSYLYVAERPRN